MANERDLSWYHEHHLEDAQRGVFVCTPDPGYRAIGDIGPRSLVAIFSGG